jgi:hypothetical protein
MPTLFSPPIASVGSSAGIAIAYQSSTDWTIWITTSVDTINWNLTQLSNTATVNAPAATLWNNELFLLFVGNDGSGPTLWSINSSAQTGQQAQQPTQLPAPMTFLSPAVVVNGAELWVIYVPDNNANTLSLMRSSDGTNWINSPLPPAITTNAVPAAAAFNGYVYVLFQSSSDNTLWITKSSDGQQWDLQQLPPAITSEGAPSLTAMNGALYAVFQSSSDETIYISKSTDGLQWDLHQLPPAITTQNAPTVTSMNGSLYVVYGSSSDDTIWLISSSDGINWSGLTHLPPPITFGTDSTSPGWANPLKQLGGS